MNLNPHLPSSLTYFILIAHLLSIALTIASTHSPIKILINDKCLITSSNSQVKIPTLSNNCKKQDSDFILTDQGQLKNLANGQCLGSDGNLFLFYEQCEKIECLWSCQHGTVIENLKFNDYVGKDLKMSSKLRV